MPKTGVAVKIMADQMTPLKKAKGHQRRKSQK